MARRSPRVRPIQAPATRAGPKAKWSWAARQPSDDEHQGGGTTHHDPGEDPDAERLPALEGGEQAEHRRQLDVTETEAPPPARPRTGSGRRRPHSTAPRAARPSAACWPAAKAPSPSTTAHAAEPGKLIRSGISCARRSVTVRARVSTAKLDEAGDQPDVSSHPDSQREEPGADHGRSRRHPTGRRWRCVVTRRQHRVGDPGRHHPASGAENDRSDECRRAHRLPATGLPAPRVSAVWAATVIASTSASLPVHSRNDPAAWAMSIDTPSTTGIPASRAATTAGVGPGPYARSNETGRPANLDGEELPLHAQRGRVHHDHAVGAPLARSVRPMPPPRRSPPGPGARRYADRRAAPDRHPASRSPPARRRPHLRRRAPGRARRRAVRRRPRRCRLRIRRCCAR